MILPDIIRWVGNDRLLYQSDCMIPFESLVEIVEIIPLLSEWKIHAQAAVLPDCKVAKEPRCCCLVCDGSRQAFVEYLLVFLRESAFLYYVAEVVKPLLLFLVLALIVSLDG